MKKLIIFLLILAGLFSALLFGLKKALMPVLTSALTAVSGIETHLLTLKFDKVEDTCWFHPCLEIQNVYIRLLDREFHGGTIQVEMPYRWPLSVKIKSLEKEHPSDIFIDANLTQTSLLVHKLDFQSDAFKASVDGQYDTETNRFSANLNTINLAEFLKPYIPQNMNFISSLFLSDAPQKIKLADQDGWLTMGDFPIIPLDKQSLMNLFNTRQDIQSVVPLNNLSDFPDIRHLDFNQINGLINTFMK